MVELPPVLHAQVEELGLGAQGVRGRRERGARRTESLACMIIATRRPTCTVGSTAGPKAMQRAAFVLT